MDIHKLKTWPVYYQAVVSGQKRFEARKDDRDFKEGDVLILQEYDPKNQEYTGRQHTVKVDYILVGTAFGIEDGYCVMSISDHRLAS
ncbi:DUF3850 domain-containing protein [bacterium]|nr:DUF3850 domain-containing protein [bacterium]